MTRPEPARNRACGRARGRTAAAAVVALAGALLAHPVWACSLEGDDVALQRAALGVAYPQSLYVLSAVSSARRTGKLDRWLGLDAPASPEESRATSSRVDGYFRQLRARLAAATPAAAPGLSIVLVEPMLWSRLATVDGKLELAYHVGGPARGDVVAVTDEPVLAALVGGKLSAREALLLGVLRLYGDASRVESVRAWLLRGDAPTSVAQRAGRG